MRHPTDLQSVAASPSPPTAADVPAFEAACVALLQALEDCNYDFVTPNTGVIALNRRRRAEGRRTLRDIFGWSLGFEPADLPEPLFAAASTADLLFEESGRWFSRVRVSRVAGQLFAHSAFPPRAAGAVFLGPDSYRFARLIGQACPPSPPRQVLDLGVGAGVGILTAGRLFPSAQLIGADINPVALSFARINAQAAGRDLATWGGEDLPPAPESFDLILANPPFIAGRSGRVYRDGGGEAGMEVALRWAKASATRLAPGGRLILYTGAPVQDGEDLFRAALGGLLTEASFSLDYEEIDPDIFGGALSQEAYRDVERIAAVAAVIDRRGG